MARIVSAQFKLNTGVFDKAQQIAPRAMARAQRDAARFILARVKKGPRPAPKRTGRLRRSYKMRELKNGLRIRVFSDPAAFRSDQVQYYAGFVERGTRNMAARPHFRPAVKAARQRMRRKAIKILSEEFRGLK